MSLSPQAYRNVQNIHRTGLSTDRPLPDTVLEGTLYFSNDLEIIERSDGTAWEIYSLPPNAVPYVFYYRANTTSTGASDPGAGKIKWNNVNQHLATSLYVDQLTSNDFDAVLFYETVGPQDQIIIQDHDLSQNFQVWELTGPVIKYADWFEVPVSLVSFTGTGVMANNQAIAVIIKMGGNASSGGGGGAPVGASYVTLGTDATLTSERVLTAGTGITLTDAGAGSTVTIATSGGTGPTTGQGTYASLPGTCAVGDMYYFTDSVYPFARCNATNVWSFFLNGKLATPPAPVSGWTAVNAGSDLVATDVGGSIHLTMAHNASLNWRGLFKAQPSTPYNVDFFWRAQQTFTNSQTAGVYFYDGTKLMGVEFVTQAGGAATIRIEKITNVTTDGSTPTSITTWDGTYPYRSGAYFRLSNSGSTLSFSWSIDGLSWQLFYSEAIGTFMTPTHYGFGGINITSAGQKWTMSMQSVRVQ